MGSGPSTRPSANATWTEEEFRTAVAESKTIAETARRLNVVSRSTVRKWVTRWGLDTSHFSGYGHVSHGVRFWRKVDKTPACWLWTDTPNHDGYGRFKADRKIMAHRFAYEEANGPVPEGLELDHLCRNRLCVRPDHLEAVTHTENVRRALHA